MPSTFPIVQPILRASLAILATGFSFYLSDWSQVALLWVLILIVPGLPSGILRTHALFFIVVCLPIFAGSLLIHVAAAPGKADLKDFNWLLQVAGPSLLTTARVAVLGLVIQCFFTPLLRANVLLSALRRYGLSGQPLVLIAGSIALIDDVRGRVGRISDAYKARGLMPQSRLRRMVRMAEFLRPLFASVLVTALTRADAWQNRKLLHRLDQEDNKSLQTDFVSSILISLWAIASAAVVITMPTYRAFLIL